MQLGILWKCVLLTRTDFLLSKKMGLQSGENLVDSFSHELDDFRSNTASWLLQISLYNFLPSSTAWNNASKALLLEIHFCVDFACSLTKKNFIFITSQWTSLVFSERWRMLQDYIVAILLPFATPILLWSHGDSSLLYLGQSRMPIIILCNCVSEREGLDWDSLPLFQKE
jgi:hypothetical protein